MLRGRDSPGGCCAPTPTKTNEVFDLQQEAVGEFSGSEQTQKCSIASAKLRFCNSRAVCSLTVL